MLERKDVVKILKKYNPKKIAVGCLGSHSALDVAEGAVSEKFKTYAFCEKGREETYARYFRSVYHKGKRVKGVVDEPIVLPKYSTLMDKKWQDYMVKNSIMWIPNRSFWVYCGQRKIQSEFLVPMVGSRNILHLEDREEEKAYNYYHVLEAAGVRTPKKLGSPEEIDNTGMVMVKVPHAVSKLERGFFTAASTKEYYEKLDRLVKRNVVAKEDFKDIRIERFATGPVCNANFFYSPINKELGQEPLELMSTEWRFESNLDGMVRLPADQQLTIPEKFRDPTYIVVGHCVMTVRESLLRFFFDAAEKFCKELQKRFPPGMIGPFGLQCIIEDDMKPTCYDVAFRIPGGDNITGYWGHVYLNTLWMQRMSTGRRLSLEIRRGIDNEMLEKIVT